MSGKSAKSTKSTKVAQSTKPTQSTMTPKQIRMKDFKEANDEADIRTAFMNEYLRRQDALDIGLYAHNCTLRCDNESNECFETIGSGKFERLYPTDAFINDLNSQPYGSFRQSERSIFSGTRITFFKNCNPKGMKRPRKEQITNDVLKWLNDTFEIDHVSFLCYLETFANTSVIIFDDMSCTNEYYEISENDRYVYDINEPIPSPAKFSKVLVVYIPAINLIFIKLEDFSLDSIG
jgi:hypothetical protein